MMRWCVVLFSGLLILAGCGVTVVPKPTTGATVNPSDRSITEIRQQLEVSARVQDLAVAPAQYNDNLTSFYVAIRNLSAASVTIPLASFVLFDQDGNQYQPVQPSALQAMLSRDSNYLIPYPYVGYYYLGDAERAGAENTFSSSLPYYAENHPQELLMDALPMAPVHPGARIAGMVYFPIDLTTRKSVELRLYLPGSAAAGPADFVFPFSIEK